MSSTETGGMGHRRRLKSSPHNLALVLVLPLAWIFSYWPSVLTLLLVQEHPIPERWARRLVRRVLRGSEERLAAEGR